MYFKCKPGIYTHCIPSITSTESRDLGALIMRIQMHKLIHIQCVIYAFMRRKIHTHLLCKFQRMLSHAPRPGTPMPALFPPFLPCGWSVVLAIANKFTSKVFICVCLAAKAKKDAHTASVSPYLCPCPCPSFSTAFALLTARPVQISFSFQLSSFALRLGANLRHACHRLIPLLPLNDFLVARQPQQGHTEWERDRQRLLCVRTCQLFVPRGKGCDLDWGWARMAEASCIAMNSTLEPGPWLADKVTPWH